ncbi:hypothetical protein REPUB_Repub06bG0211500 [Reevesia pubescens]
MKTLTSSCSKAIIDKNRDKGLSCFKDISLNSAELCLLPSQKLVRIRFLHSISVQHRRFQPVFSSSSLSPDSQVDLETTKSTQPEEENPSKTAHVKFLLQKECSFGEHFFMVGDHPMFGLWDPESAIPLTWSEGHVWTLELDIPVGVSIQFKFILKTSTGNLLWQPGPDRIFKSWNTENTIIVCEDWEEAEYQKVIEEQPLANPNEPLIDSEMAIVEENLTPPKEELVSDINLVSEDLGTIGRVETVQNPATADVEGNLVTHDGSPVLVPDLTPLETLSTEEAMLDEDEKNSTHDGSPVLVPDLTPLETLSTEEAMLDEDEKNSTTDASIGINETTYHELSELDEKQEPEDEAREEKITTVSKDREEQLDNQHIQKPQLASEEQPDLEPFHSNVLQSDAQWGRKTLQKLLDSLRFI